LPNYPLTAHASDQTSLTDGKYTFGHFWASRTTVGWENSGTVEILIDLEKSSSIDTITFSTARGNLAGVNYPANIHAFIGTDKEHFFYAGDVAQGSVNSPGAYETRKFKLESIKAVGRYVLFEV